MLSTFHPPCFSSSFKYCPRVISGKRQLELTYPCSVRASLSCSPLLFSHIPSAICGLLPSLLQRSAHISPYKASPSQTVLRNTRIPTHPFSALPSHLSDLFFSPDQNLTSHVKGVIFNIMSVCGCSKTVMLQLPKLATPVRLRSPAPFFEKAKKVPAGACFFRIWV